MKRLFAALLALIITVSFASVALADDTGTQISVGRSGDITLDGSAVLTPGKDYSFALMIAENGGETRAMRVEDLEKYDLWVSATTGGQAMKEAGYVESSKEVKLALTPANTYAAANTPVAYTIYLYKKGESTPLSSVKVSWKVGYQAAPDETIGAKVAISAATPVITAEQMAKIKQAAGSDRAVFTGEGWQYSVRLAGEGAANFLTNKTSVSVITQKYPNAQFSFFTFGGKPTFVNDGTLTLDVSAIADKYEDLWMYRYMDGVIYSLGYSYDEEAKTVSVRSHQLGSYFFSDEKIPNGTYVGGSVPGSTGGSGSGSGQAADTGETKDNPSTGGYRLADFAAAGAVCGAYSA